MAAKKTAKKKRAATGEVEFHVGGAYETWTCGERGCGEQHDVVDGVVACTACADALGVNPDAEADDVVAAEAHGHGAMSHSHAHDGDHDHDGAPAGYDPQVEVDAQAAASAAEIVGPGEGLDVRVQVGAGLEQIV